MPVKGWPSYRPRRHRIGSWEQPPWQTTSRTNEEFVEPPRDEIPGISRQHVAAMETSDADEIWVMAGMRHVLLRTIGRKSGNEHKVALPYWSDPDWATASWSPRSPERPSIRRGT